MHNMFFVNNFRFPKASELVDKYDMTSHSEKAMISIARLRKSISPKLRDGDSQGQLPACCVDIHVPTAIFHVLKTFVSLTIKVDVTKIEHQSWPVDQQKDDFSCGIHILQMLVCAEGKLKVPPT
ncbi:hypothetical protein R1sor_012007 [Riccia sorocarpa]|uniref:Ubiquitin-like protease family profile domain-containing protein n=1 Tax=Riccia sorocarpa TaxID=122646 RepID=A0ABD3I6S8_9MARC